jgi:hypothetical protein
MRRRSARCIFVLGFGNDIRNPFFCFGLTDAGRGGDELR